MATNFPTFFIIIPLLLVMVEFPHCRAMSSPPLSTASRWIVDVNGQRVKLGCVNWVSHMQVMVAEGLSKQPMDVIVKKIVSMGFNCVRLTWSTFMVTNHTLSSLTVKESFTSLGLVEAISGLEANNPSILHLPLIQVYQMVVSRLGEKKVMVILDNQISKAGWCCDNNDGNGFFGDQYFKPHIWLQGLTKMATLFQNVSNVVAMSLRNELRGPKQNLNDWYRYMESGAEAVHAANSKVLVILSGLNFDTQLSYLRNRTVNLTFTGKLVFEAHWYRFTNGQQWEKENPNKVCGRNVGNNKMEYGYLVEQGSPLILSEFGKDQRGTNVNDNKYFNCIMSFMAELDLDWVLWTLSGSYYLRQGVIGMEEPFGVLDSNWTGIRDSSFLQKLSVLRSPFRGPGLSETQLHKLIFHPSTGLCITRNSLNDPLILGPCNHSDYWTYTPQKTLSINNISLCLQTNELGSPTKLQNCTNTTSNSQWELISDSGMHLSSRLKKGQLVCLDVDTKTNIVVTNSCKCLSIGVNCDPASQWFKLVDSTRKTISVN